MAVVSEALPNKCWAVLDGDDLALMDGRLPLFWLKTVARDYNHERLLGKGRIVRVVVSLAEGEE
jgi:hypothetical protein